MATSSADLEISVNYLRRILNFEDEQILECFTTLSKELHRFINSAELTNEAIEILIHLIACASRSEQHSSRQKNLQLLQSITESPILNNSGAKLLMLKSSTCKDFHSYPCLLIDFLSILQKINGTIPSALNTPQKIGLVSLLKKEIEESDDLKNDQQVSENINELQECLIRKLTERAEAARNLKKREKEFEDRLKPPDDFRCLSVMPREEDLLYQTLFLRRNKAKGKYNDLDHYLDVQFRLYREDCIVPLRYVYEEFIRKDAENENFRLENGRIYRDVNVQRETSTSIDHGEVFSIQLNDEHRQRIRWNNSKRLIFGSVLLLSFDRFKTTLFVLVSESKPDEMKETGTFRIKIFRTRQNHQIPRETPGILLEATSAYFEAYHHVLTAMQSIKEDNLPFQKYIVSCNNSVEMPFYLAIDPDIKFDLGPVLSVKQTNHESSDSSDDEKAFGVDISPLRTKSEKGTQKINFEEYMMKVTDKDDWPSEEELGMDESQRKAFISSLTKEFVLIQGPPGTGKTYIGLQIAKTLLHNREKWKIIRGYDQNGEMIESKQCLLIVCYTNHALDQFVEGIIDFIPEKAFNNEIPSVIRIGNQSKNEAVNKYSIKNQRHKVQRRQHAREVLEAANRTKDTILSIRAILKIIQGQDVVLHFRQLKNFMSERHVHNFQNDPSENWLDWIHISPKSWFLEVQRKRSQKKRKRKAVKTKISANLQQPVLDIVTEAEYEYSERSLDENVDFKFNGNSIGINVNNQLSEILTDLQDRTCIQILHEEAEIVSIELKSSIIANHNLIERTGNLWNLSFENRWKLYRHWLRKYVVDLKERLKMKENEFNEIFEDYKKARLELDEEILKHASVIAMTTTGAAKYHQLLMQIGPQITIIEEAAEVPEAHIVTAINPACEHLILIGDHKQLEPKPAVRELATRFNLSISLFERMLNNGLEYDCLQRQHRMRPEISELVRHMYPKLYDNSNVLEYENIKGIRQNLFFITHEYDEQYNRDGKSFSNEHEAEYVKELCTYLLKQGYKRSEITILAAYTGQMFLIRGKMPRAQFEGINTCVLDNYQGEENEIILLSLVRSNDNGDIGFLRRGNRICVALSRAKKGLYIIGNSKTLTKDCKEWQTVVKKIKSNNKEDTNHEFPRTDCGKSFGKALPLYCQNHPEQEGIRAELPADFTRAPEGGCELFCGMTLKCGHVCHLRCHPYDTDHVVYECRRKCLNECDESHQCNKHCHFPKSCNCEVIMERILQCHHTVKLKCHIDPLEHQCLVDVTRTLQCEHNIILKCHINYEKYMCRELVTCTRDDCRHEYNRECHDIAFERRNKCERKVEKTLKCGHIEIIKCYQNIDGTFFYCTKKCLKQCYNNHICDRACHFSSECHCDVKIDKTLPRCGHDILIECSEAVNQLTRCTEQVDFILERCGHHQNISCSEKHRIETAEPGTRESYEKRIKCREIIPVDLPKCGHTKLAECWKSFKIKEAGKYMMDYKEAMYDLKCSKEVVFNLECGHSITTECCKKLSYENNCASAQTEGKAGIECETMVGLHLVCGHTTTVKCFESFRYENMKKLIASPRAFARAFTNIKCSEIVDIELNCGHMGQIQCSENENHVKCSRYEYNIECKQLVEIQIDQCGHTKMVECYLKHNKFECHENSVYTYPKCGHKRYFECCQHPDIHKLQLKARTAMRRREMEECDRPLCLKDCEDKLTCGHKCPGFCSEPCPVSCKNCDAANFFEGDEGIKTVTIKECGHSFGYIYLDRHMKETGNELTSHCPGCGQVFNWHPRYDKILKRKKTITEELKENFQKITKQSNFIFPLCDSKIVQQFHNYIGSFTTYVQIIWYIARDKKNIQIKSLKASAENISRALRRTTSKCLQHLIDISDAIFRLYVKWMLQIVTSNEKLLERKFNSKNVIQNQDENQRANSHYIPEVDIDSSSEFEESNISEHVIEGQKKNEMNTEFEVINLSTMFEEKSMVCLSHEPKSMEIGCDEDTSINQKVEEIPQTEVEEWLTGLDIVKMIEDAMTNNKKSEVKRLLNIIIPFMRDEPHFTEAMQCPQLTSVTVIGVHEKDWKICKQGHLTSTLIHQNCYTCSDSSTSVVSAESKEGVLWKTHFQHLTEKFDLDIYNQGKGNEMSARQKRNKRNKSNNKRMPDTFEKNTKQTNTEEVRTQFQGSNRSSDNLTLQDYIHTNTDGGSYRGNSRGRGRGRGKKNRQTGEVAERPFQTRPVGYQGYNMDFNSPVVRPQTGHTASNFMESNFGRSTEGRGTGHNGIWQRNCVPQKDQIIPHHAQGAGHNWMWQKNSAPHREQVVPRHVQEAGHNQNWKRNSVPHQEQVAGTFGINIQQNKINNEPNENFKPFKAWSDRPNYDHCSSESRPGSRGNKGRGRRGRRGGRGDRN
ncbi:hypothetical protein AM593_03558, partial [Mytilus galloprovincialis]